MADRSGLYNGLSFHPNIYLCAGGGRLYAPIPDVFHAPVQAMTAICNGAFMVVIGNTVL